MASEKISQLPAASTSSGSDLYPIVQNGNNYSITYTALQAALAGSTTPSQLPTISLIGDVTGANAGGTVTTSIASSIVTGKSLTGYVVGGNTAISATDTILSAFGKLQGQLNATDASAITQLTGDGTAVGPGSSVFTLKTVNSNIGSFALSNVTVNAKGLVTAASASPTTGTGSVVLSNSPSLVTPSLDTPSSIILTNATGLPLTTGVTGTLQAAQFPALIGDVTTTAGSLTTSIASSIVTGKLLTGYTVGTNTPILSTDTILSAFGKVQAQLNSETSSAITALIGDVVAVGPGSVNSTIQVGVVTDTKASLASKPSVAVVSTTNLTLSGLQTIDGFTVNANSLVLLTAQTTASQNGPWQAQTGAWTRPSWYPSGGTTQAFQFINTLVRLGTVYQGSIWRQTAAGPITIDTTPTTWVVTPLALNSNTLVGATPILNGGTGQTTAAAAYNALSPMTTTGDIEYEASAGVASRLGIGSAGQILTVSGGVPVWANPATSGTVTSVALTTPGVLYSVSGSPITSSGTLALSLINQSANTVLAGPSSGSAGVPSFRSLVASDIPILPASQISGITGTLLTGYAVGSNTAIAATDTILSAFGKVQAQLNAEGSSAITSLTGDGTATGPGAAAFTLASVNSNVGSFALANITVNAKGLVTAASAPATTGSGNVVLATSPTLVTPALGTPSALVLTNATGLPLTTGVAGTLPTGNGGTGNNSPYTAGSVIFAGAGGTSLINNSTNFWWDNTNFRLGIGTNAPDSPLTIDTAGSTLPAPQSGTQPMIHIGATAGNGTYMLVDAFNNTPQLVNRRADGTATAPTAVQSGDILGNIVYSGYGATSYQLASAAKMTATAAENFTDSTGAAYLSFYTRQSGTVGASTERVRIDQNGGLSIFGLTSSAPVVSSAAGLLSNGTINLASSSYVSGILPVANGGSGVTTSTGTGSNVLSTSPTLVTPILGTPTSVTLTNATGLPLTTGVTGILPIANGGNGVGTVTTTPTPLAWAGWDANNNFSANEIIEGFTTTATSGATTTLTVASSRYQYLTGTANQTIVLPVVSTLANGFNFTIINASTGTITVNTSGGNLLQTMAGLSRLTLTCINTTGGTGTASWSYTYSAANVSYTTGSIAFGSSAGVLTQDNANLYWNDTNHYLGIGTNAPVAALDVGVGVVRAGQVLGSSGLPTVSYGAAAGTGPSTVAILGNQMAFYFQFTTGTLTTTGSLFTITVPVGTGSYGAPPVLIPQNAAAAAVVTRLGVALNNNTSWTVSVFTTALTASTNYAWYITCPAAF